MSKRDRPETSSESPKPKRSTRSITPLSPSLVSQSDHSATVNAIVTSISPAKPSSKCFRGELADNQTVIPCITFDKVQRDKLEEFSKSQKTVTLTNCQISVNKPTGKPEVIIKGYTVIDECKSEQFTNDRNTIGSPIVKIESLESMEQYSRVTVQVMVTHVGDIKTVSTGKYKQELAVADETGVTTLTLWENDIDNLEENVSYQLNRVQVNKFQGKTELVFPNYGASITVIPELKNFSKEVPPSQTVNLTNYSNCTIEGVQQLSTIYTCISSSCKSTIECETTDMKGRPKATCNVCGTVQILRHPRRTARLFIRTSQNDELWLRAYSETLNNIVGSTMFTPEDLIDSPPFDLVHNQYGVITQVQRQL